MLLHVIIERDKNMFGIVGAYSSQASRSGRIRDGPGFEKGTHIAGCPQKLNAIVHVQFVNQCFVLRGVLNGR